MKLKNILRSAIGCAIALGAAACSNIDENERLIPVEPSKPDTPDTPTEVTKAVLIEDFTGQRCVNCPNGTDVIASIVEAYGENNVIAVGVHSGPLGFSGNKKFPLGLMTDTGNEYYNHYNIASQPCANFNRTTISENYNTWVSLVKGIYGTQANLSIAINNTYDDSSRSLTVDVDAAGIHGTTNGKLQVWLIEDGIVAMQMMPDGKANAEYVHNHVFRAAVNGTWGEDVTVKEGEHTTKQYTYTLPAEWVAKNVSVVAFVYNDNGVEQAAKAHIVSE